MPDTMMVADPVSVFWTFIGIFVWPGLTLCIILWKLGHPVLGVLALITISTSRKKVVKERIIDSRTGRTIEEREASS